MNDFPREAKPLSNGGMAETIWMALRLLLFVGGLGLALATLLGLFAPWSPYLELVNHFRPILVAASIAALGVALLLRGRTLIWLSAIIAAINLVLFAAPLSGSAATASDGSQRFLRVVSLNVGAQNHHTDLTAEFLLKADGDVVVLVELRKKQRELLLKQLTQHYPHQIGSRSVMLLSKLPAIAGSHLKERRIDGRAAGPFIWARFERDGTAFELAGVHFVRPFTPRQQISETDALIDFANGSGVPMIIAGDFNLTPWSTMLQRFGKETGLKRSITIAPTWPVGRMRLPFVTIDRLPFVTIDNVFVSREFSLLSATVGPYVGSDHKPVIVDLAVAEAKRPANSTERQQ